MIFVTLGSQKFQFNRLLKAVDKLAEEGETDEIFAQIGYSDYLPKNYKYKSFLNREEFSDNLNRADIIITHGGTGAIMEAVKKRKKIIAVPRLAKYGEHVDNHQLQLINQFKELDLIYVCNDCDKLDEALETVKTKSFKSYQSNTARIIESIEEYIGEITK
ncbi:UDP-N-acetylglucosamine transferase subunit ALG13 [Lachnospiraceae bacterium G41]|nr:UDP-N-acetylglucosamine transferase subunit ALG13 [Lachnospiraceae bacterium G41]